MRKNNIPQLPSLFISDTVPETLDMLIRNFGFPMVLKIPDGSFSIGVKKANNRQELIEFSQDFLKQSALILVQQFLKTNFDWRIGILDNRPFFACKYFMSKGHWQIYNHNNEANIDGDSITLELTEVPQNVLELATDITKLIGQGLYGVDIKEIDGKAYIVEVNDNPNIDGGIEDAILGDDLYSQIIQVFTEQKVRPSFS